MHKLQALIPLLGWFYISLFVYAVFSWVTKGKFRWIDTLFLFVVGAYAVLLSVLSITAEVKLYPESRKSLFDRFDQKIAYEAGEYYKMYYQTFRPVVHRGDIVNVLNVSTREYYYARMYLYPAGVIEMDKLPDGAYVAIVGAERQDKLPQGVEVVAGYAGKYLIRKGTK